MKRSKLFFSQRKPRHGRWLAAFAVFAVLALAGVAIHGKFAALAWQAFQTSRQAGQWRGHSLWLPDYRAAIEARPIEGIESDASSLTFDERTGTLWLSTNAPSELFELSTEGTVLRRIPVKGVADMEAIAHIEGDEFALVSEGSHTAYWVRIGPKTQEIDVAGAPHLKLDVFAAHSNRGFEGSAWNARTGELFLAKEKHPLAIQRISGIGFGIEKTAGLRIREWRPKPPPSAFMRDFSSLSVHAPSGHILVLSDESKLLAEYSADGRLVSLMPLRAHFNGLSRSLPQAEGVAVDNEGTIFVVSEPNLFYRFEKQKSP
jgi:uncharacterized protein YjiK